MDRADSASAIALFTRSFGGVPAVVASAPGRVNIIGEHTDYNGGEVLPIAIERRTWVALGPSMRHMSRAVSGSEQLEGQFDPRVPTRSGQWWDYVSGVSARFAARGAMVPALDIAVVSDVPVAAGLSSSAAIAVAMGAALASLSGFELSMREIALLAHDVETNFVGVSCGIMDQFASALACRRHALHLRCDSGVTHQTPLEESILIFDTAVSRSLRGSAFNDRRRQCNEALALLRRQHPNLDALAHATPDMVRRAGLPTPLDRRALHVVEETRRVRQVVQALEQTAELPGDVLLASHASLRDLYECSSAELDWFVERVMGSAGVRGARLTGAGWGGCAIAVGSRAALDAAAPAVSADYTQAFGRTARTWITTAQDGAAIHLG